MEDFKWLIYILGAVIILVVRMWLKAFQSPKPTTTNRPNLPQAYPMPAPPATSYRDILKEMQASGDQTRQATPARSLENNERSERTMERAKTLERTESRAKSLETIPVRTKIVTKKTSAIELARQVKAPAPVSVKPAVNYGKLLQDPQNLRAAFILSQILNRPANF